MKKLPIVLNALLTAIIGGLLPSCKTPKNTVPAQPQPKQVTQETSPAQEELIVEPEKKESPERIRVLYGPPSVFRNNN